MSALGAAVTNPPASAPLPRRLDDDVRGSAGTALPEALRGELEAATNADLGDVRVHAGAASASAAQTLGAKAYTSGQDIHFAAGAYAPETSDGQKLIAHEVAHTVQQKGATAAAAQAKAEVSAPGDAAEVEADQFAERFASGELRGGETMTPVVEPARLARRDRTRVRCDGHLTPRVSGVTVT